MSIVNAKEIMIEAAKGKYCIGAFNITDLVQMEAVVEAVAGLAARGIEAPVFRPNSQEGGRQHNERLRAR